MRLLRVIVTVALFSSLCLAKDVKIHGFVTTVNSPTNFEIDDYRITRDTSLVLEVEKDEGSEAAATFHPEDIHVGTELEIKGDYNEQTGELKARYIRVFSEDTIGWQFSVIPLAFTRMGCPQSTDFTPSPNVARSAAQDTVRSGGWSHVPGSAAKATCALLSC